MHFVDTMLCTDISTPVTGQLALDLMLHPPKAGDPSYDTHTQVRTQQNPSRAADAVSLLTVDCLLLCSLKEMLLTRTTLFHNAQRALELLNNLPGMSCQPAMGGIYLYPRLDLTAEIREQAEVGNVREHRPVQHLCRSCTVMWQKEPLKKDHTKVFACFGYYTKT